jgi:anthranilate synthase component 1
VIAATAEQLDGVRYGADGLVPAIVQEAMTGQVLMMAWMSPESLRLTLAEGRTVFWSRSRQELWRKGETSGEVQRVREAYYDCDADVLLFVVDQEGDGACHTGAHSCFYRRFGSLRIVVALRIRPTREEFCRLATTHTVVPVWTELLADLETPVAAYAKVVGDGTGFLLESVEHGERWSRFSFVGRSPVATLVLRGGRVEVDGALAADVPRDQGILAALDVLLDRYRAPRLPDLPPLQSGVVGYLGYDVVREIERLPDMPPDDRSLPDAVMSVIGSLVAFDHWRQRAYLIESVPVLDLDGPSLDAAYDDAVRRVEAMSADLARPLSYAAVAPPEPGEALPAVRSTMPGGLYQQAVEVAKEHIRAGDIFQVVLAQRYDLELDADPFDVYRVLRQVNPSPYMYFLRHPEVTIVGSSPEPMVQLLEGRVISRPIAGTRRRGRTDEDDRRMAGELRENPKEVAEHIMLVDLARNDVGRIARFGTMHVDELLTLERYSHVMHLTSQVSGDLVEGRSPIDVLRATLPAGTVSGAPKVRAMEIIDALEPVKRGPYAGVVGYVDFSGNLDTAIAIRTMFVGPQGASLQAGAGIVADSIPDDEDLECRNKAAALLAAVPAARRMTVKRAEEGTPA